MPAPVNLFWFRRDLRLHDNAGLYHALKSGKPVQPIFIFDRNILDQLEDRQDRRVSFIHEQILLLQEKLKQYGATLDVRYGKPEEIFLQLINDYNVEGVYCNHDYEPYARERDHVVSDILKK
ncbi:MAG: deoxyribodipyrimidine photo-lyase [Chitinophagaceae bacterium]|nr:deoxyribodipyrimidine photo-lyase [Chitinophagaceae bacterium]